MWSKVKKEHLVVFLMLLASLILFNYFDEEFGYTGQVSRDIDKNEITGYGF
tara:strand:+ start:231 stop:383 length:153 start_codon:yes stop_codon:yes gene_type:complete